MVTYEYQSASDKLIYGVGFIIISYEYEEDRAHNPLVEVINYLSSF